MALKGFSYSKSIVAQKDISEGDTTAYITQLSKPIIIKGVSTKKCPNVLYSIDGMNFTEETTIGDDHVLSMAVVPFQIGGADIDSNVSSQITTTMISKAFSYILGGRDIHEDLNISNNISYVIGSSSRSGDANGAYRYLLQYLAKNKDKIEWDTGDLLFSTLDADNQDSFGGSDFITDEISVREGYYGVYDYYGFVIDKQEDANGSILKPTMIIPDGRHLKVNYFQIQESPYFFLHPESCPAPDSADKLIIDNFWRGGGALISKQNDENFQRSFQMFMLYIFAVS